MKQTEISIIVPVFNAERYLENCITSLQKQSFQNYEILLVNDGSTDSSSEILHQAALSDKRLIVIDKINGGPSSARNVALKQSSGKYVMFCDCDDTVDPLWIETMYRGIIEHPDSMVCCGMNIVTENGKHLHKNSFDSGLFSKDEYYRFFKNGLTGSCSNKIFRSDIIKRNNILFNENLKQGEDVIFNLDYLKQCTSIFSINDALYNYHRYSSEITLTNRFHENDFAINLMLYKKRIPFISEKYRKDFDLHYWHVFCQELERTRKLSGWNWFEVFKHNKSIVRNGSFQELLKKYGSSEMNHFMYQSLRYNIYSGYSLIQRASEIKRKLLSNRGTANE